MLATHRINPGDQTAALDIAARLAMRAPSALNTQPWRWRVRADMLELRADRERQLASADPDGRLLLFSCGAALHHARTSLAADGYRIRTERLPDPAEPDLLARIRVTGRQAADAEAVRLRDAIGRRRTDRRAYGDTPVPAAMMERIRRAAEAEEAYLHVVLLAQMPMLAIATMHAAATELADPAYRTELTQWTHRPRWIGGVAADAGMGRSPAKWWRGWTGLRAAARRSSSRSMKPRVTAARWLRCTSRTRTARTSGSTMSCCRPISPRSRPGSTCSPPRSNHGPTSIPTST
jgi:nitroreductase